MREGLQRNSVIVILLLIAAVILLNQNAYGQLRVFPLPQKSSGKPVTKSKATTARTKGLVQTTLPFWDDFSFTSVNSGDTLSSNYPIDSLWYGSRSVWVNNGMGINPPSLNVATLDGLDSTFSSYSDQVLTNGFRDTLQSQPIKLGEDDVALFERNSVYLSFHYQWQGNGEAPDLTDYLLLEFKNSDEQWEPVLSIYPKATFLRTEFYDTLIKVDGDRFFHDNFQFRFKNFGRLSGPYDTWNIDYVYLNKNRSVSDTDSPDQAISSTLTGLFDKYTSIPYDHFLSSKTISQPKFNVHNSLNDFTELAYLTEGTFYNYKDGIPESYYVSNLGGSDTSAINDNGSGIIFPLETRTVTLQYVPDPNDESQFDPLSDSVRIRLKTRLFTGDTFDPKDGSYANDYDLNYLPIDFRINDTTSHFYTLKDFYAYDDGTAEYAAGLTQAGNRAAVLFEMRSAEKDTLVGIDIYVPKYGLVSNLTTDFYIFSDDNGVPGGLLYSIPSFSIVGKGLNTFQRIRIVEPFLVDQNFYVGWKAPVGGTLKIGLDLNNDSGEKIFVNTTGTWSQNTDVTGSLMIRPVFGNGEIVTGVEEESATIEVYPNPSSGEFYIRGLFEKLTVVNTTGQLVPFEIQSNGVEHKVILNRPSSGLYLLRMQNGNIVRNGKIIVK